jgi:hypothetical protein
VTFPQVQPGQDRTVELKDKAGVLLSNGFHYLAVTPEGQSRFIVKLIVAE